METITKSDESISTSVSFLEALLRGYPARDFAIRLWDGTTMGPDPGEPVRFTLAFRHPGALKEMFSTLTELSMGEAYIYDDIDIEGDLEQVFPLGDYFLGKCWSIAERLSFGKQLSKLPVNGHNHGDRRAVHINGPVHSKERDRQAVTYHYDVSNDFFKLWLDSRMVYSCAYFVTPDDDLDVAQHQKLEYICRKLRLRRGERLLDIGCGWGALVIHAARYFGVNAVGITLSQLQADLANERIQQAGLAGQCRVDVRDYREPDDAAPFDKLVSVGMFEHVGGSLLSAYFAQTWHLLKPGGVFLLHGIARSSGFPVREGQAFTDHYVFPDSELLPIHNTLEVAELNGFEVRDVESLREHYAMTLRHWVKRLQSHHMEACRHTDEVTYRIWRLFMSGSAYGFQKGRLNVYQTLLSKPMNGFSGLPLTRQDWYMAHNGSQYKRG